VLTHTSKKAFFYRIYSILLDLYAVLVLYLTLGPGVTLGLITPIYSRLMQNNACISH